MHHSVLRMILHKIIMNLHICFFAIVIVRVDHHERLVQYLLRRQHRLAGSPGLRPVRRFCESLRQLLKRLERIFHFRDLLDPVADHTTEFFFNIFADNKDDFVEPCFQGVVDGIIHDDLACRPYRRKLFDPFSKTASDPGRHDHQRCFLHNTNILRLFLFIEFTQFCRLIRSDQTVDDLIQVPAKNIVQTVQRKLDPVVCNTSLGKIVSPYLL